MKLRDLKEGDKFVFKGETFTKIHDFNGQHGNAEDKLGNEMYFHPSLVVQPVKGKTIK